MVPYKVKNNRIFVLNGKCYDLLRLFFSGRTSLNLLLPGKLNNYKSIKIQNPEAIHND